MKNKEWYENIPEQGVLCFNKITQDIFVYKDNGLHNITELRSLTPKEWWSFAPCNYDVKDATKYKGEMLLKDVNGYIDMMFWQITRFESLDSYLNFEDVAAWIPLPENK